MGVVLRAILRVRRIRAKAAWRPAAFCLELPRSEGPLIALWDREWMMQVLANLVGNALRFSPEGGFIEVVVEPAGGLFFVAVSDRGPGVPKEAVQAAVDEGDADLNLAQVPLLRE